MKKLNLIGQRFTRFLVIAFVETRKRNSYWSCRCDCGEVRTISGQDLKGGHSRSCGCLQRQLVSQRSRGNTFPVTHGQHETTEYAIWEGMIQRCTNPKNKAWKWYGARGITICVRWLKFENFLADMGQRPAGKSIDRYPNNGGNYEPGNCRWATQREQVQNSRRYRA